MEVVPTITTTAIDTFEYLHSRFYTHCKSIQIDIQDGAFVPNKTFSVQEFLAFLQRLIPEKLETYKHIRFDFHLMVREYASSLAAMREIRNLVNVRYVFVHTNLTKPFPLGVQSSDVCPTINPEDPPIQGATFLGKSLMSYPAIQIMTIHPGPQGQSLISGQLERIKELRLTGYAGKIVVDGSMNPTSLQYILSRPSTYHPDIVCVGSYFSRAPDQEIGERIETLKALVK